MKTFPLFSINAHRIKIKDWSEKHRDRILAIVPEVPEDLYDRGSTVPNPKIGYKLLYTDLFKNKKRHPPYAGELFKLLDPYLQDFFKQNEVSRITSLWCQKYKSGDYHEPHDHGSKGYSAVLYAKLNPKVHTGTKFFSPFPNEKGCKENIYADAEEGDLLIFPAHLLHMAPSLYDTDELRVIFSFNLI